MKVMLESTTKIVELLRIGTGFTPAYRVSYPLARRGGDSVALDSLGETGETVDIKRDLPSEKDSTKKHKRKTIRFSELKRLSIANSDKLPSPVQVGDRHMEWVGIGWIDVGPAKGDEVLVVEG